MAIAFGPLHSDSAYGTIGKQLSFRRSRRGSVVTRYAFPGSVQPFTPSEDQLQVRAYTRNLMRSWPQLSDIQRATWDSLAVARGLQPINVYQQVNFARMMQGLPISPVYPPVDTPPDVTIYFRNANWISIDEYIAEFADGGHLTVTPTGMLETSRDLLRLQSTRISGYDGQWYFSELPLLKILIFQGIPLSMPPMFDSCPALEGIYFDYCGLRELPSVANIPSANEFAFAENDIPDVDPIFIEVAARNPLQTWGSIDVSGGTNSAPTAASAAARSFLTTAPYEWDLQYN